MQVEIHHNAIPSSAFSQSESDPLKHTKISFYLHPLKQLTYQILCVYQRPFIYVQRVTSHQVKGGRHVGSSHHYQNGTLTL